MSSSWAVLAGFDTSGVLDISSAEVAEIVLLPPECSWVTQRESLAGIRGFRLQRAGREERPLVSLLAAPGRLRPGAAGKVGAPARG